MLASIARSQLTDGVTLVGSGGLRAVLPLLTMKVRGHAPGCSRAASILSMNPPGTSCRPLALCTLTCTSSEGSSMASQGNAVQCRAGFPVGWMLRAEPPVG